MSQLQIAVAVSTVAEILQPDMPDEDATALTSVIARRGYTSAELAWATDQLLVDASVDKKLSFATGRVTAADFERVIVGLRTLRKQLSMPLRQIDINKLVTKNASLVSIEDFGVCGFDSFEQPLYRFCYNGPVKDAPGAVAMIDLPENTGSERQRDGDTGPRHIGTLIERK